MLDILTEAGNYLMAVFIIIGLIALYAGVKTKWDFSFIGKGAIASLALAVVVVVCLFFGISAAYAKEYKPAVWFDYTELFAGVDYTKKPSPSCEAGGVDDRLTSNIGVRQHIVSWRGIETVGQYTHHSCVIGEDDRQYDSLGAQIVYRWGGDGQ